MQMLKFGRLVDLERLENVTVNRTAEELKERLRQQELQNANDLAKWEVGAVVCADEARIACLVSRVRIILLAILSLCVVFEELSWLGHSVEVNIINYVRVNRLVCLPCTPGLLTMSDLWESVD